MTPVTLSQDFLRFAGVSRSRWESLTSADKHRLVSARWPQFVEMFLRNLDPIARARVSPSNPAQVVAMVDGAVRNAGFVVPGPRVPTTGLVVTPPDPLLTGPAVKNIPIGDATDTVAHYMDETLAASVLYRLAQLSTPDPATGLIPDAKLTTYPAQLAATQDLFTRIGAYYKAANVRPQSDPLYVQWWMAWFGSSVAPAIVATGNAITDDAAWGADNGVGTSVMNNPSPCIMNTRLLRLWTALRKDPPDGDHPLYCHLPIRMELNQNGDVLTMCTSGSRSDQTGLCDFNRGTLYVGCAQDGAGVETPDRPHDWNTFCWNDPLTPPGSVRGLCRIKRALLPMKWFYDAAIDLSQRLLARTGNVSTAPVSTVSDAITYATLWNLSVGHHYGILPAELEVYAANLPSMQHLAEMNNREGNARVVHNTLGAAASLTGNPYAQAYAALVELAASLLPAAVAAEPDFFGRAMPFALKVDIQRTPAQLAPFDPSGRFGQATRRTIRNTSDSGSSSGEISTPAKLLIGAAVVGTLAKLFGWF